MSLTFEHHLKTGSGSTQAVLFLTTQLAIIEFDSQWMGGGVTRYRLYWAHTPISPTYGILNLRAVERYIEADLDFTIPEDLSVLLTDSDHEAENDATLPERYTDIIYEYIRLSTAMPWIADEPDLEDMKHFFGLARWPEQFDLLLWQHFSLPLIKGKLTGTALERLFKRIDKMKFVLVAEDEHEDPRL